MIVKQFEEKPKKERGRWTLRTCFLVRARDSELRELKRQNELLWQMLWTASDFRRRGMHPKGELVWTSPDMTVDETLRAFDWLFPEKK